MRWVSVLEKSPSNGEEVLCTDSDNALYLCTYINEEWIPFLLPYLEYRAKNITHWRTLPGKPRASNSKLIRRQEWKEK